MPMIPVEKLVQLQHCTDRVRNICILAHVDHGKTTLADSLVAANGIISSRMIGKLRYLDSRPDEQERGITMKSSAIALYYVDNKKEYLINLIDSPGHIDFCGEVSTATRVCDGAVVVVDVVEGVCPQTHAVLRQAWREGIRPLLVLNKMDRLILELKMTAVEAYRQLELTLEQVNALAGQLFLSKMIDDERQQNDSNENGQPMDDDEDVYFAPEKGNVVFASAVDGWGFRVDDFVAFCVEKTGLDEKQLRQCLWGDYYLESKSKTIRKGAFDRGKKPLFAQLVLDTIWTVYQAVMIKKEEETTQKILKTLKITLKPVGRHQEPRTYLQNLMSEWLPLAFGVLSAVCQHLPAPNQLTEERAMSLICEDHNAFLNLPEETRRLKEDIQRCSSDDDAPILVFVSKMFVVDTSQLPESRRNPFDLDRIRALRAAGLENTENRDADDPETERVHYLAFAKVFSGKLKVGQKLYLIAPNGQTSTVEIKTLYLMMGRELETIVEAPAGNVVAIGGLEEIIFKSGTLSSTAACRSLAPMHFYAYPIVRVSVEAKQPSDMPKLIRALKLLNQTDPSVKSYVQESGEHVLVAAGEVHLQRCLLDLRDHSRIELNVSEPIIPFHETIVKSAHDHPPVEVSTTNKRMMLRVGARPLPPAVSDLLDKYRKYTLVVDDRSGSFKAAMAAEFERAGADWADVVDNIWSFGPKRAPCNILVNRVPSYKRPSVWMQCSTSEMRDYDQSIVTGFQLRCQNGPLCDEPVRGVAFFVYDWEDKVHSEETGDSYGPVSGQLITSMKEACKLALQAEPLRLVMAMYSCVIQATGEVLGKVYAVLGKRAGKVLKEDMKEGTNLFQIDATLPVVESFGFADELRKRTSGLASPQLVFSHWEILDIDPFWTPNTEEELSFMGDKADTDNLALKYMNAVRRRKGLAVDEKIIEHAEKQRTLSKKA